MVGIVKSDANNKTTIVKTNLVMFGTSIVLVLIGLFYLLLPELAYELNMFKNMWKVKDSSPSEKAIKWNKGFGIALIITGVIIFIVMIFK